MIEMDKIFTGFGYSRSTNIMELLLALVDPSNPIDEKKNLWDMWQNKYYSKDEVQEFFGDTLFSNDKFNFLDVFVRTDGYKNFYELAFDLDQANLDPQAYYLFFILNYGHKFYTQIVKDAFDYDPDTILAIFPDINEVILENN